MKSIILTVTIENKDGKTLRKSTKIKSEDFDILHIFDKPSLGYLAKDLEHSLRIKYNLSSNITEDDTTKTKTKTK